MPQMTHNGETVPPKFQHPETALDFMTLQQIEGGGGLVMVRAII